MNVDYFTRAEFEEEVKSVYLECPMDEDMLSAFDRPFLRNRGRFDNPQTVVECYFTRFQVNQ